MIVSAGRATEGGRAIEVSFQGAPLTARTGDTLASALMAQGRLGIGADPVTGRPRGLRWLDRRSELSVRVGGRRGTFDPCRLVLRDRMKIDLSEARAGAPPPGGGADTDILVIGAGPAGLTAAETALGGGARVLIVDRAPVAGGSLLWSGETIGRQKAAAWCEARLAALRAAGAEVMLEAEILPAETDSWRALRRDMGTVWTLRAAQTIFATGALARMPAFSGNDLPGVMTAATMLETLDACGVAPGQRIAVLATSDDGFRIAQALSDAGLEVVALVDTRPVRNRDGGWPFHSRSVVRAAEGDGRLEGIEVEAADGTRSRIACDGLAVAAGWSPQIAPLLGRVRPIWNPAISAWLVPPGSPPGVHAAGASGGTYSTRGALKSGYFRARKALAALDRAAPPVRLPAGDDTQTEHSVHWHVPGPGPAYVDFTAGVTLASLTTGTKPEEHGLVAGRYVADSRLS